MTEADTTNAAVIAMRKREDQEEGEIGGHCRCVVDGPCSVAGTHDRERVAWWEN